MRFLFGTLAGVALLWVVVGSDEDSKEKRLLEALRVVPDAPPGYGLRSAAYQAFKRNDPVAKATVSEALRTLGYTKAANLLVS